VIEPPEYRFEDIKGHLLAAKRGETVGPMTEMDGRKNHG
jgi:hypothetical protein